MISRQLPGLVNQDSYEHTQSTYKVRQLRVNSFTRNQSELTQLRPTQGMNNFDISSFSSNQNIF